jgi:hypothetical protein
MKKTISLILVLALCMVAKITKADFTFGEPVNLGPPINTPASDGSPHISPDGLALYFSSGLPGNSNGVDLHVAPANLHSPP